MAKNGAHLVVVQYGDYAEGYDRIVSGGGKEDYYAQKYTMDLFSGLVRQLDQVTIVTFSKNSPHRTLPNGVKTCGLELYPKDGRSRSSELIDLLDQISPTMLIVVSPILPVLFWAYRRKIRTLPLFMDSFRSASPKARIKHWLLAALLNRQHFEIVANHGLAAANDLARIGVDPGKVLPFDWPAIITPEGRDAKKLEGRNTFNIVYVGQISEAKGVGDIINALKLLNGPEQAIAYRLNLYGRVVDEKIVEAAANQIQDGSVAFRGMIDHDRVIQEMSANDIVIIPSRHEYPEGIPMTIYESFCSRSPLVASDHPMFAGKLVDGVNCVTFSAGNVKGLAEAIRMVSTDDNLYRALSENTLQAAANHFCDLKYHALIGGWISGEGSRLKGFSLSNASMKQPLVH